MNNKKERGSSIIIVIVLLALLTAMLATNSERLLNLRDQLKHIEKKHND